MKEKNRENRHIVRKKICTAALFLCALLLTGCGDDGESIYNFSGVEPKEIDPWVWGRGIHSGGNRGERTGKLHI